MATTRDEDKNNRSTNKHDEIDNFKTTWGNGAEKRNWKTKDDTNVKNVATDNIAD